MLLFDIETNGLIPELTLHHCLVIKDTATGEISRYNDQPHPVFRTGSILQGVERLHAATHNGTFIAGHNVIKFDIPALKKLIPAFKPNMAMVWDTLVLVRLLYADIIDLDIGLMKKGTLPKNLFKRHSLEAWGYRLGVFKDEYAGDPAIADEALRKATKWAKWNQSMDDYCVQDIVATSALWDKCLSKMEGSQFKALKKAPDPFSVKSVILEHAVASIIAQQERYGVCFNRTAAGQLYAEMVKEKLKIEEKLKLIFKPRWFGECMETVPPMSRRDQEEALGLNLNRPISTGRGKAKVITGYCYNSYDFTEGAAYTKVKLVEFNPGSRVHIAIWLKELYGWEPTELTPEGAAKIDETILKELPYPEAQVFSTYLTIGKRLGQLSEGKESWLRHERDGWIFGSMVTNGAVTGRATHSNPNMGQVPKVVKADDGSILMGLPGGWGFECRSLFGPPPGRVQVGIDMSGIELRCLAHYMARYDDGAYGLVVTKGDVHTVNQKAVKLPTRDNAKTFIYAFLYGAGGERLGKIIGQGREAGEALKRRFLAGLPALKELIDAVSLKAKQGYLKGLDGRLIKVRHRHAALNSLLQSCGAILSKQWQVLFHEALVAAGIDHLVDQMLWVHDEIQLSCDPSVAEQVGAMAVQAIADTGTFFNFRVPITGEYKIGKNWAECH